MTSLIYIYDAGDLVALELGIDIDKFSALLKSSNSCNIELHVVPFKFQVIRKLEARSQQILRKTVSIEL